MSDEALAWPNPPTLTTGDDGVSYNLGVSFTITASQSCTGVQWRVPDSLTNAPVGGSYAMSIWDDSNGSRLAFQTIDPSGLAGTTHNFLFGSPVALSAGKYVAAIFTRPYVFRSDNPSGVTTPSGSATANEGRLVSFSSGSASTATFPDVNFTATYYVSPLIALAGSSTVAPTGVAIAAATGAPTAVNAMNTVSPTGLNKTVALGTPTAAQTLAIANTGLAVPVALGQPTVSMIAGTVAPTGVAVPVVLGQPTVSGQPYVQQLTGGSWWELESILSGDRALKRFWDTVQPLACPNDGEPLKRSVDGILYCQYDNWRPDNQVPNRRRPANLGRDWGGLRSVQHAAAMDAPINQLLLACPNDGEPLSIGHDGTRYCKWDGWMPPV